MHMKKFLFLVFLVAIMLKKVVSLRVSIKNGSTIEELKAAWSQFSVYELKELRKTGCEAGPIQKSTGAPLFYERELSPLHQALSSNNLAAVKFFLVSMLLFHFLTWNRYGILEQL